MNWNVKRFSMLNISQVILMRTDSNLCRKELTVHWSAPNSLIRSYLQPCTNSMSGDESEAVAPIIWLYQIVDAQKEEVFFQELLITLRSYDNTNGCLGSGDPVLMRAIIYFTGNEVIEAHWLCSRSIWSTFQAFVNIIWTLLIFSSWGLVLELL